jgi:hypothetical protein
LVTMFFGTGVVTVYFLSNLSVKATA